MRDRRGHRPRVRRPRGLCIRGAGGQGQEFQVHLRSGGPGQEEGGGFDRRQPPASRWDRSREQRGRRRGLQQRQQQQQRQGQRRGQREQRRQGGARGGSCDWVRTRAIVLHVRAHILPLLASVSVRPRTTQDTTDNTTRSVVARPAGLGTGARLQESGVKSYGPRGKTRTGDLTINDKVSTSRRWEFEVLERNHETHAARQHQTRSKSSRQELRVRDRNKIQRTSGDMAGSTGAQFSTKMTCM